MPQRLAKQITAFSKELITARTPDIVLSRLHEIIRPYDVGVFAAGTLTDEARLDLDNYAEGQNLFFGKDISPNYWPENQQAVAELGPCAITLKARDAVAPFTFHEVEQQKAKQGKWIFDFLQPFGIADGVVCPLRQWTVILNSPQFLKLSDAMRCELIRAAAIAATGMDQMVKAKARRRKKKAKEWAAELTPRELEMLQERSRMTISDIAKELDLSEKTVNEHLRRVRLKLGVDDITLAVAQAFRKKLIR
jgi:DNA-binding CsgD family transcriptional regulator